MRNRDRKRHRHSAGLPTTVLILLFLFLSSRDPLLLLFSKFLLSYLFLLLFVFVSGAQCLKDIWTPAGRKAPQKLLLFGAKLD